MKLIPLEYHHYGELMEVAKLAEPWMFIHRASFDSIMSGREGFVLIDAAGSVQGAVTFSDYRPADDIIVHCSVHPEYHRRWLTKEIYRQVFDYVFVTLELHRCSGFRIDGTGTPETFHERLGFKLEGVVRQGVRVQGERRDIYLYGMLKDERRW